MSPVGGGASVDGTPFVAMTVSRVPNDQDGGNQRAEGGYEARAGTERGGEVEEGENYKAGCVTTRQLSRPQYTMVVPKREADTLLSV